MPYAPHYAFSAHPPLPLHPKVPRPWALDTYSTVATEAVKVSCGNVTVSIAKVPRHIILHVAIAAKADVVVLTT